jgi:ATP-dependent RNA helicase DHX8/PRP22
LPGIKYVVDSGKHKCRHVLPTGMDSLSIQSVSQAQAAQRSGRAGRIQAGVTFRLYTEEAFHKLAANSLPEILRVNLAQVVLQLKGMGITDPASFDFVTPPDQASLVRATKLLYALAALNDKMELTDYGKKLAKLPLDPVFGHLLLQSAEYGCVREMLSAVAVLSAENLFYRPTGEGGPAAKATAAHRRFASHEGDLPTFLNVYKAWQSEAVYVPPSSGGQKAQKKRLKQEKQQIGQGQAKLLHGDWCQRNYISGRALARAYHVRQQLQALCARPVDRNGLGMDVTLSAGKDPEVFLKCAAAGLFLQAASRIKTEREVDNNSRGQSGALSSSRGRYKTKLGNEEVSIHPSSTLFGRHPSPSCVVFTEMVTTTKTYVRGVTQIREEWLHDVAPNFYS